MLTQQRERQSIVATLLTDHSYRPEFWNENQDRLLSNNCYTYALGCFFDGLSNCDFPRPGDRYSILKGREEWWRKTNSLDMERHLCNDGLRKVDISRGILAQPGFYLVACFVDDGPTPDFHFMRQHPDGRWSHKIGAFAPVSDRDSHGNLITDPRSAARSITAFHTGHFMGFFEVPNTGIALHAPLKSGSAG
jgi:hypothetical protein